MSENTLNGALRRLGRPDPPHVFRSIAGTLLNERAGESDLIEYSSR